MMGDDKYERQAEKKELSLRLSHVEIYRQICLY
jgi:hypothetical protein